MSEQITEIMMRICDVHRSLALPNLKELGIWQQQLDDNWSFAVNGTSLPQTVESFGTMGAEIPPFHAAIWWNGWLAGIVSPFSGSMVAHPDHDGANETHFLRACKLFIEQQEANG